MSVKRERERERERERTIHYKVIGFEVGCMNTLRPGRADSSDGYTYISQNMLMCVVVFVLCARAFGCLYEIMLQPSRIQ